MKNHFKNLIASQKRGDKEEIMKRGKQIGLLFMATVAVVLSLAATQAGAQCTAEELSASTCFVTGGYEVRTVAPLFPVQNPDSTTTFNYTVTPVSTSKNISMIDMLVPICSVNNAIQTATGDPNGWGSYGDPYVGQTKGSGSPSTGFGLGNMQYFVFEQNFDSSGTFYIHTTKAASQPTSMALKIGNTLYAGSILGPACYDAGVGSTVSQEFAVDPLVHPGVKLKVEKQSNGNIISVTATDKDGQPLPVTTLSLKDYPYWVCLDADWHYSNGIPVYDGCNGDLSPVTHIPEGAFLKFGNSSWISYTIGGTTYVIWI
ncbi:MAG: hypothetical protein P8013_04135 [Candidatus Sulfobium sp.]